LVGQDHIKITLQNAFKKELVSHAYLFCGPRGTGKTSTARLVAKSLNCPNFEEEKLEPCDECEICEAISNGSLIDVIEIDAASNRGIDEIRELRETIKFAPTQVKNKIYIIDEVHMLTKEAFNAFLKTLEEPPENVYFILATTEVHKIPDTILSRCPRFDFKRLTDKTIETRLAFIAQSEKIDVESGALDIIARHVDGGMRDAIGLLEQLTMDSKVTIENTTNLIGSAGIDVLESFIDFLTERNEKKAVDIIQDLYNEGYDLRQFEKDFIKVLRDKLLDAIHNDDDSSEKALVDIIDHWQTTSENFRNSIIPQLVFEVFIIKLCSGYDGKNGNDYVDRKVDEVADEPKKVKKATNPKIKSKSASKPKPESESKPKPKKQSKSESKSNDADIKKLWQRTLDRINKPVLHRSLAQARIKSVDNEVLNLVFNSEFHYKTVNKAEYIDEAETILAELADKKYKLELTKEEMKLSAVEQSEPELTPEPEPKPPTEADSSESSDDLVNEALELFGGEVVE